MSIVEELFAGRAVWTVLRHLERTPAGALGREIGRELDLSHPTVHRVLQGLARAGIVRQETRGRGILYTLDRDHFYYRKFLKDLLHEERWLPERIVELTSRDMKRRLDSLILFGSRAKGSARPTSDVDLLALVRVSRDITTVREQLDRLAPELERSFRAVLSPVVMTTDEYRQRLRRGERIARDVAAEGRVVYGRSKSEVLRND